MHAHDVWAGGALGSYLLQTHDAVLEAVGAFQQRLQGLYAAPRLHEPLWLSWISFPQRHAYLSRQLYGPVWARLYRDTERESEREARAHRVPWPGGTGMCKGTTDAVTDGRGMLPAA
jgi:hypothetical protein